MTTNVYDLNAGLMTVDSRWSIETANFLVYADDTGFDKLYYFNAKDIDYCVMFAGNSWLIHNWKEYLKAGASSSGMAEPEFENNGQNITMCIAIRNTKEIEFERGQNISLPEARFAGTGAYEAHGCWKINSCARKAVESAKMLDRFSGGEVKFVELSSLDSNIDLTTDFSAMKPGFLNKGMVMYKTSHKDSAIPLQEAAANDAEVKKVLDDISNGSIVASAPSDGMYTPWDEVEKGRLRQALKKIFD